jgi:Amt family ammonium transporter
MSALLIGIAAGSLCYIALNAKTRFGYDDSLDAFGVHGVGGVIGTLGVGLFASAAINGVNGLFFGNPKQLLTQAVGVVVVAIYSFVMSLVVLKVVDALVGLRVKEEGEIEGLDINQHGEEGYFL